MQLVLALIHLLFWKKQSNCGVIFLAKIKIKIMNSDILELEPSEQ